MTAIPMSRLWTIDDVSEFLGIPVKTLYQWRTKQYGPKGKRVGRYVRYKPEDVMAWVDAADEYAS
jgi:predicted DNA-binding transcriptional regulator AlpA